jgi:hypothetical protein
MQNRYVGDVGDFGKYGLLRTLGAGFSFGVVWYLVPDESHTADGKHISYLTPNPRNLTRYRECDPGLYDVLAAIVDDGERAVASVRQRGVLPAGTVFYEDRLSYAGMPSIGPTALDFRLRHRRRWTERALAQTQGSEIVFLDPDNGFESGIRRHEAKGPKYVYFDEVQPYLDRGQSVVVYHHLNFSSTAVEQVARMIERLRDRLDGCDRIHALLFQRGSLRVFFVVPAPAHEAILQERVARFARGPWSEHFRDVSMQDRLPVTH